MAAVTGSTEARAFVTMRFKRIKTWGHVYHVRRHNSREMSCPHVDRQVPPQYLIGGADVAAAIREVLQRYEVEPNPGEVLALEFIVSASRKVFEGIERDEHHAKINELIGCTMRAFRSRFGISGQIVSVVLHKDETTPHLHVVVVPLLCAPDNRRKDKTPSMRLSAKRVVGGRGDMSREQTRFASFFAAMKLERGQERSRARHVPNREHEAMLEAARQRAVFEAGRLMSSREQLDAERAALASERADLEAQRQAVDAAGAEAAALKARALKRTRELKRMLQLAEDLRREVLAAPSRSAALDPVRHAANRLEAARLAATADDDWLATALAVRSGGVNRGR
ncbi:plasmid recombination protein [Sphingomonas sp. PB4P5]|uniref:plasmid recombination protein n=1 Tax=Parasphingomonas puruogangriensis TaxID=3096155 RepID=UPI002FCAF6EF